MSNNKSSMKTREDKIAFLKGLKEGTRSVQELIEMPVVITDKALFDEISQQQHKTGSVIIYIPDNGRQRRPEIDNSFDKNNNP
jgi:hypothetical protein